jgi:hypothetical protein
MRLQSNRPGFALPLALLVIGFLTVGVATALTRADSENRTNQDRQSQADAFALAQSGLERFAVSRYSLGFRTQPPAVQESARITLPNGYADVILRRIRPKSATEQAMYLIRSRGTSTTGSVAWAPPATHTVAQYSFFREGSIEVLSGWTSLTGLRKNGGAGTISGEDHCGVAPDVAGVAIPDGGYVQNGGTLVPEGTPDTLFMGTQAQMAASINIDWDGIVNGNAIPPDYTIPGDPWPTFTDPTYWPVIRIDGNYSIPTDGFGTLIVTGDLTINGALHWDGIVLVGGTLTADGNNTVLGATITGLNVKLGMSVPINDVGNGEKTYQYDSCNVAAAASRTSALVLIPNTWVDNWKTW